MRLVKMGNFTLAQIVTALVALGLILGTILLFHRSAKMGIVQADMVEVEKYKIAATSFRTKYNYFPGDMPAALAAQLRLVPREGGVGRGDGNHIIEGHVYSTGQATGTVQTGEPLFFWEDLHFTGYIKEVFDIAADREPVSNSTPTKTEDYLPKANMGKDNYIYVYSDNKQNYLGISAGVKIDPVLGNLVSNPGLTAEEAYKIDKKIDDGMPNTGKIIARFVNGTAQNAPLECFDKNASHYTDSGKAETSCALSFVLN